MEMRRRGAEKYYISCGVRKRESKRKIFEADS